MDKILELKGYAASLGLTYTKTKLETIIHEAEKNSSSYLTFLYDVLYGEIKYRQDKAKERRIKEAGFPYKKYLKDFDLDFCTSITKKNFHQQNTI